MSKQQWIIAAIVTFITAFARAQTVEYIHTDALGSPVAVTNASGTVVERTVYEPYGAVINRPITNGPGYTGHVLDAVTGLNYMQQRYYDPQLGRFLSNDPVTATSTGANLNRYWYANNNPYRYIDPDGRCPETGTIIKGADGNCPASASRITTIGGTPESAGSRANSGSAATASESAVGGTTDIFVGQASGGIPIYITVPSESAADVQAEVLEGQKLALEAGLTVAPVPPILRGIQMLRSWRALRQINRLVDAANVPVAEDGLSAAARALSKHSQRAGGTFERATGNVAQRNAQAERVLREILGHPGAVRTNLSRGGFEIRLPNGQGVRYDAGDVFSGFIDPPIP